MKQKLDNIQLLETPIGTEMYLMFMNRSETRVILRKVKYAGYSVHQVQRDWYEPKMIAPAVWTEPEFTVKFIVPGKKTPITFNCSYTSYWTGERAYDTDFHEECNATNIKGISMKGMGEYSCIDAFFTTDKKKLEDKFNSKSVITNLNQAKSDIDNMISSYQSFFK